MRQAQIPFSCTENYLSDSSPGNILLQSQFTAQSKVCPEIYHSNIKFQVAPHHPLSDAKHRAGQFAQLLATKASARMC